LAETKGVAHRPATPADRRRNAAARDAFVIAITLRLIRAA
jgi:hypothetical protein